LRARIRDGLRTARGCQFVLFTSYTKIGDRALSKTHLANAEVNAREGATEVIDFPEDMFLYEQVPNFIRMYQRLKTVQIP